MSKLSGFSSPSSSKVILNVYDLNEHNDMLYPIGLGLFHSGVQFGREEYTFGKRHYSLFGVMLIDFYLVSYGFFN